MLEVGHLFFECINSSTISLLHKLKTYTVISGKIERKYRIFYWWCKRPYIIFHFLNKARCKRGLWLWLRGQIFLSTVIRHTYKNIKFLIIQQTSNLITYCSMLHTDTSHYNNRFLMLRFIIYQWKQKILNKNNIW